MTEPPEHPACEALKVNLRLLSERRTRQSREIDDARRELSASERDLLELKSSRSDRYGLEKLGRGSRSPRDRGRDGEREEDRIRREAAEEVAELTRAEADRSRREQINVAEARVKDAERKLAQAERQYDETDRALSINVARYKTYGCRENILNFIRM